MKMNQKPKNRSPLPLIALAVIIGAVVVTGMSREKETLSEESAVSVGSADIVIQAEEIGTDASWFDYHANGVTVQAFAVRASDGTIRLALNTCQICNGSPYAYFEQDGDWFICQNCGNRFASAEIGIVSGGCRPVPITEETYTELDGAIAIPAAYLEENTALFQNWKDF